MLLLDSADVIGKHILQGDCYLLSSSDTYDLKAAVATQFEIHHTDVYLVGSAMLGFSIKPDARYREFGERSDIDVAIVNDKLYARLWLGSLEYGRANPDWRTKDGFMRYHLQGWIRPDLLPHSRHFAAADRWFDFFRNLTSGGRFGQYKISAGLYYSMRFLELYQSNCVQECQRLAHGD